MNESDEIDRIAAKLCECLTAIGETVTVTLEAEERVACKAAEDLGWIALALDESDAIKNPAAREALDAVRLTIHAHLLTLDPMARATDLQASLDRIIDRVSDLAHDRDAGPSRRVRWA